MILADKIINERKKNGWSQEELAEQLSVSRQSVSKWEGAQAIPDLKKIIKMSEIFNVSTDYLLKDEIEPENKQEMICEEQADGNVVRVSMEEANSFLNTVKNNVKILTTAIVLCIMSPVVLIFMAGLSEIEGSGLSENVASFIGLIVLFVMVSVAVYLFIIYGSRLKQYEYLYTEIIETEYGVSGMVKEKKKAYSTKFTSKIAAGVLLCILSVIPLVSVSVLEMSDFVITSMVCVLLTIVSLGVRLLVTAGVINSSYDKILQENDYSKEAKKSNKVYEALSGCYWLVVTAIYLCWSFITEDWDITWIVWAIAGILYGVFDTILRIVVKEEK